MFKHRNSQFDKDIMIIHPGEFIATGDDIILATLLGSCIAVGLWDLDAGLGGLNHFMLPLASEIREELTYHDAKYGIYAMELLINDMMKLGASRSRLMAKVFGGGSLLGRHTGNMGTVPANNIAFALKFLEKERINVISSDTGGMEARKIYCYVKSAKVLLKRIKGSSTAEVAAKESNYGDALDKHEPEGNVTLF